MDVLPGPIGKLGTSARKRGLNFLALSGGDGKQAAEGVGKFVLASGRRRPKGPERGFANEHVIGRSIRW